MPGSDRPACKPDTPFTTIPVPVSFSGMPNTRWWAFEEKQTNFGDIDASTTDLAKLLFMEFALVYSNDWFVVPSTLPAGTLVKLEGLAVTNVFGERFWIEAAGKGMDKEWGRWSMFTINVRNAPTELRPTRRCCCCRRWPRRRTASRSRRSCWFATRSPTWRGESSARVALPTGVSRMGSEVAAQTFEFLQTSGRRKPPHRRPWRQPSVTRS